VPPKIVLQAVAALVVITFLGLTALHGVPNTLGEWLAPIGPAVLIAGIGLVVFDRYAWKWPGANHLVGRPVLDGTWHGELLSDWVDPETNQRIDPIPDVFLIVRQRYWSISIRQITKESESVSIGPELSRHADGVHQLTFLFSNVPKQQFRHRSQIHYGGAVISAPRSALDGLQGRYFTDRKTGGDMHFSDRYKTHIESHAAGLRLVATNPAHAQ
jgi:hypothetical protein